MRPLRRRCAGWPQFHLQPLLRAAARRLRLRADRRSVDPRGHRRPAEERLALCRAPAGRCCAARWAGGGLLAPDPRSETGSSARAQAPVGQGRLSQSDALVQGSGGGRRGHARPRLRIPHAGVCIHRQPGRIGGGHGGVARTAGHRVRAGRPGAREGRPGGSARGDRGAGRRTLRRGQPALPGADRRARRLGRRQRQPASVLLRGLEDHRVRDRRAARMARARRGRCADRIGIACTRRSRAASRSSSRSG